MARYRGLAALKEDALSVGATGAGVLVGAGVAKWVVGKLDSALKKADAPTEYMFPGAGVVAALAPAAVGIAIQTYGASRVQGAVRDMVSGVSAGMVAFSLGKLVVSLLPEAKPGETGGVRDFLPFNGLGGDGVYDYSLGANSSQFGPGGVSAYMMNGFGDAPTTTEMINGLGAGAPVDIQSLSGLGSAPVQISTYAPLNTALTA